MAIQTFRGVQALRLLSAVLVVAVHACRWYDRDADPRSPAPQGELLGDVCVATFFLISGFVVVHVVDTGHDRDWRTFAVRRAIRVLPLAWAMTSTKIVAALVAPGAMFDGGLDTTRIVASYLLVPSRDPAGAVRMLWGVEWTLVLEVAFYGVVAVALAARIDPVRLATPVLLVAAALSLWQRDDGSVLWFYADPVVLFLVAGMWLRRAVSTGRVVPTAVGIGGLAVVGAGLAAARGDDPSGAGVGFLLVTAAFGLVVAAERRRGRLVPAWVVAAGDSAFALYLTHPLVAQALPRLLGLTGLDAVPWLPVVVASTALSVLLGLGVHRFVDRPVGRALRRRLVPTPDATRHPARAR